MNQSPLVLSGKKTVEIQNILIDREILKEDKEWLR
jgi:hypothetical protein